MTVRIEPVLGPKARDLILASMGDTILDQEQSGNLDFTLARTTRLWVGLANGELACAWGLAPATCLSDKAYLWLHHTPKVAEHTFLFIRHSQRMVETMLQEHPEIHGMVKDRNSDHATKTIRWLRWLGAEFGVAQGKLLPFVIRKKHGPS